MNGPRRNALTTAVGVLLCLFTVVEVNYPLLQPPTRLALFAMLGLVLCFLHYPPRRRTGPRSSSRWADAGDYLLAAGALAACGFIAVQSEPLFARWWLAGTSLGNRAGMETGTDTFVGIVGLLLVLEATRRSIGWALPLLSLLFLAYAAFGSSLPGWLFPHRGYGVERIVAQTFLHSQGVFGTALQVMFVYVFLFVLLGAFLRVTGATGFIIDFARRVFAGGSGGPAKVAVLSSGMMGSLSGSAVANTATTGTFTIPMMRSSGFPAEVAAGVEAAASSGGALVPPVMGAGAYMMLEIIDPPVSYLQIVKAALLPAILYYVSLLLIVHFYAKRRGLSGDVPAGSAASGGYGFAPVVFVAGFACLLALLVSGYTVFRAASLAVLAVVAVSSLDARTRLDLRKVLGALGDTARDTIALVAAAACVGIVIGVVTLTGIGTKLPAVILSLSQHNVLLALTLVMVSSIILGMGLPSAVCYLLMATLVGPVLGDLGVVPLGAHLFIFYFGMMSMVTPPVALAAYTAASIAGSPIMKTGLIAFRFALVGFTLPYMFVLRPGLLMLDPSGAPAGWARIAAAFGVTLLGIVPFAAAIAGQLFTPLRPGSRIALLVSAALLLGPGGEFTFAGMPLSLTAIGGVSLLAAVAAVSWRGRPAR